MFSNELVIRRSEPPLGRWEDPGPSTPSHPDFGLSRGVMGFQKGDLQRSEAQATTGFSTRVCLQLTIYHGLIPIARRTFIRGIAFLIKVHSFCTAEYKGEQKAGRSFTPVAGVG